MRRQSLRRNIGQPRTLLPLSRSWFKGTLLEAHWPYRRGQVTTHLRAAQADGGAQLRRCQAAAWAPLCPYAWATQGGRAVLAGRGGTEHQEDCDAAGAEAEKGAAGPDWRFVRMLLRLVSGLRCSFDYPLGGTRNPDPRKTKPHAHKNVGFVSSLTGGF
ncbi:putative transposase [Burkholderia mallei]|nr:putative transposase [Burkholderia mallei]